RADASVEGLDGGPGLPPKGCLVRGGANTAAKQFAEQVVRHGRSPFQEWSRAAFVCAGRSCPTAGRGRSRPPGGLGPPDSTLFAFRLQNQQPGGKPFSSLARSGKKIAACPTARRTPAAMDITRQSLLLRAQTGDEGAWKDLPALYRPLIVGWLHRQGVPVSDHDDLSQDILLAVVRSLPTFRHSGHRGAFR